MTNTQSLITEEERKRIKIAFVRFEEALGSYIRDFENRLPINKFRTFAIPMIKDLQDTKYEHNHDIYARDLCTKLHTIKDKLDEFTAEINKAIRELREVCNCGL